MPDITAERERVIERMREVLDDRGIELTRDDLGVAALAAISALTEQGMILEAPAGVALDVQKAIAFFRGPENDIPDWPRERWVNALTTKLGQAAHVAGILRDIEDQTEIPSDASEEAAFDDALIAVAAACQDAVTIRRSKRGAS